MALYRQINLNSGSVQDKLGAIPTVTGAVFSNKEKGLALETNSAKYVQYDKQLLPTSAFSLVAWIKLSNSHVLGTHRSIILSASIAGNTSTGTISYSTSDGTTGKFILCLSPNNYRYFNFSPDKLWHCVVVTCPGATQTDMNNTQLFVDGILQTVQSTVVTTTQLSRAGFTYFGGGDTVLGGNFMSKLKVYDTVLTQKQIEAEYKEFSNAKLISKVKRGLQLNKPNDLSSQKPITYGEIPVPLNNVVDYGHLPITMTNFVVRAKVRLLAPILNDYAILFSFNFLQTSATNPNFGGTNGFLIIYQKSTKKLTVTGPTSLYTEPSEYPGSTFFNDLENGKFVEFTIWCDFVPGSARYGLSVNGQVNSAYAVISGTQIGDIGTHAGTVSFSAAGTGKTMFNSLYYNTGTITGNLFGNGTSVKFIDIAPCSIANVQGAIAGNNMANSTYRINAVGKTYPTIFTDEIASAVPLVNGSTVTGGLIAAYNMRPIGNTLVDVSGNNVSAVKTGTMIRTTKGITSRGAAGNFTTATQVSLDGDFSVSWRMKVFSTGVVSNVMFLGGGSNSAVWIYFDTLGRLLVDQNVGGVCSFVGAITNIGEENTYTLTFVNATHTTTFYKNGIQSAPTTTYNPSGSRKAVLSIGGYTGNATFSLKNDLQDLRIHNRIISLKEIKNYHNSFVHQPYILEDFNDANADGSNVVPNGWIRNSGSFKVGEYMKIYGDLFNPISLATGWSNPSGKVLAGVNLGQFVRAYFCYIIIGKRYRLTFTVNSIDNSFTLAEQSPGRSFLSFSTVGTRTVDFTASNTWILSFFPVNANSNINLTINSITEINPLPTFKQGTKYLECVTTGVIALPSNLAYGTYEFSVYKGADANATYVQFIAPQSSFVVASSIGGYDIRLTALEALVLVATANTSLTTSANAYIQNFTWYNIKITRTQAGVFTTYIKGGTFGNDYVLLSASSGTNPATYTNYTTSNFISLFLSAGDRFTNLIAKPGIEI